jgi:hypothetical protein
VPVISRPSGVSILELEIDILIFRVLIIKLR